MRGMIGCGVVALVLAAGVARAQAGRPIVVELFTSQGCSSCPPADALLGELARDPADVLALGFHVTYWNRLGWRDPFSFSAATQRQRDYQHLSSLGSIYTPEMVIEGRQDVIGSDRMGVARALAAAEAARRDAATVSLTREPGGIAVHVAAGQGAGTIWLVGYAPRERTAIGRGENAGRTETEANVVRSLTDIGTWNGAALSLHVAEPAGGLAAVIVQVPGGPVLGAGVLGAGVLGAGSIGAGAPGGTSPPAG